MADLETKKIYTIEVQGVEQVNDLKKSIDDLNNTMKGAADSMSSATESTKAFTDNLKNANGSVKSVKDLKAEISGLRDKLVTLEAGSEDYKAAVQNLIQDEMKLKEVMQAGKAEVNAAAGSYNALQREMSVLRQVWKETTDEATRNEIGKKIAELNTQLKAMDASIGNFQRNVGNYPNSMGGMVNSFNNLKQELRETKIAMEQMNPASEEYANALNRAAEITHELSEQQELIRYSTADLGDQLSNIRGIATNMAAGFTAVNAAMGLFGSENKEVQQALLKVQQTMALVQGLQGLDGLWKRTKGLSNAMKVWIKQTNTATVAVKKEATATAADAAAKKAEEKATEGAEKAQWKLNAAIAANPIGAILTGIMALVTVFQLLGDSGDEAGDKIDNVHSKAAAAKEDYIKMMEAMYGATWKFTEDGKKAMDEYFNNIDLDVSLTYDEWKEKDNERAQYIREYYENQHKLEVKAKEDVIKDNEAKAGSDWKYTEEGKKAYQDKFDTIFKLYAKDSDEYKQALRDKWSYDREYTKKLKDEAEKRVKDSAAAAKTNLDNFKREFDKYVDVDIKFQELAKKLEDAWDNGFEEYKNYLITKLGKTETEAAEIMNNMAGKIVSNFWNDIITTAKTESDNYAKVVDENLSVLLSTIEAEYKDKKISVGLEIPEDELKHIEDVYTQTSEALELKLENVKNLIYTIVEEFAKTQNIDLSNLVGDELENKMANLMVKLRDMSPEFANLIKTFNDLSTEASDLEIERLENISNTYSKALDAEAEEIENLYNRKATLEEAGTEKEQAEIEKRRELWGGLTDAYTQDTLKAHRDRKAAITQEYDEMKAHYQEMADLYQKYIDEGNLTAEEEKTAKEEIAKYKTEVEKTELEKQKALLDESKEYIKTWKDAAKSAMSSIGTAFGNVTDYYYNMSNMHKEEIKKQLEAGEISEEEAKKREETAKEEFEKAKKFQIAETIINTLSSAMGAYQSLASIPYVGPVLGAAAAAAALMLGYSQVEQIKATQYESATGGSSLSSGGSTNFQLPNVQSLEPSYYENTTKENNTDILNNGGETEPVRCYVVESDITASQELANKRNDETTF